MDSSLSPLENVSCLYQAQRKALLSCGFKTVADVVLTPPNDIAKKLRKPLSEVQHIVDAICKEISKKSAPRTLSDVADNETFTTADSVLDGALGGGVRTSTVLEVCGESASGKTQLALQLSLSVQLPKAQGGLSGSACFLSTLAKLPTNRLAQIKDFNPSFSSGNCDLSDIHIMTIQTFDVLLHALRQSLPALMKNIAGDERKKPVKLVIIDSLSGLFDSPDKTSTVTLGERSKLLTTLSSVMHAMAAEYNIAFVIVNTVKDVFFRDASSSGNGSASQDIVYSQQSKWFNSDPLAPGGHLKEATLGLVWANQLNTRIMLTRTNRRRMLDDLRPSKRRRTENGTDSRSITINPHDGHENIRQDDSILLRRLAVLFSSVCEPRSTDFVITESGLSGQDEGRPDGASSNSNLDAVAATSTSHQSPGPQAECEAGTGNEAQAELGELDDIGDDDVYWSQFNDFTNNELLSIDFDGMDEANINEELAASQAEAADL